MNSSHIVRREMVVADALRYVHTLRGHMQWEELDLFRRVEKMIAGGHEFIEAATYLQGCDPVFGPEVEQNFENLVKSIRGSIDDE